MLTYWKFLFSQLSDQDDFVTLLLANKARNVWSLYRYFGSVKVEEYAPYTVISFGFILTLKVKIMGSVSLELTLPTNVIFSKQNNLSNFECLNYC